MLRLLLPLFAISLLVADEAALDPEIEIRTIRGSITCRLFAREAPETVRTIIGLAEGTRAWTDPRTGTQVQRPFYDGLTFHRVIPGFMIQGGCPLGTGIGGPGLTFADEINAVSLGLDTQKVLVGDQLNPQCAHMAQQFVQAFFQPRMAARGITATSTAEQRNAAIAAVLPELAGVTLQQFYEKLGYVYDPKLAPSHRPIRGVLAMANSGPNTNGSQFFINLGDTPHLTGKHTVFGEVVQGMEVAIAIAGVERDEQDKPKTPVQIIGIRRVGSQVPWPGQATPAAAPAPAPAPAPNQP